MWMTNGAGSTSSSLNLLSSLGYLFILKKLHTGRVITSREITPMYILNNGFRAPKVDGILPHFLVLHRMMRRTLAPRINDSDAIPAYERNLLDALIKYERFDVFDYIVDEIWNIAINPL
jgi:hypothetical protein